MNKFLKIGGITLIVLFVVSFAAFVLQNSLFSSGTAKSKMQFDGIAGMGVTSRSATLPMSAPNSIMMEKSRDLATNVSSYVQSESSSDLSFLEKRIKKNGSLDLKVGSADEAAEKISGIAKSNGGEIFSSSFYQASRNVKNGTVVARIPVANFEKAFSEIKEVASLVVQESISADDMTEQYVDLQAQLRNKRAEEEQFSKILSSAQKIDDVLAVTKELSRVRGNIEQLETRIKYLEQQTDMSTISANVSEDEDITVVDSWRPLQVMKESLTELAKSLQSFIDFMIRFVVVAIPLILLSAAMAWIVYGFGKKIYVNLKKKNPKA